MVNAVADKPLTLRDFRINEVSLIAANGSAVDIRLLMVELILRQDIFTNYMHGEAIIVDGVDMFTIQGLHGSEYLYLDLHEPEVDERIRKAFRIFKITDRTTAGAQTQRYKIHFVSEEMFVSNIKLISKSYKGETISTIAKEIFTNHLATDKYIIDETDEAMDIIVANMRPTEALNWLAARATTGDKNSYLFFENLDGFNFKSLYSIYEESPCNDIPIRFEAKSVDPQLGRNKYNIDSFNVIRDFDTLTLSANGGICMRMLGIDPFHRTYKNNDYDIGSARKLHNIPSISDISQNDGLSLFEHYESNQSVYLQTEDTSTEKRNNSEKWISRKLALANIRNSLMDIVLPGNMIIQAGKLINLYIPHMIPATTQNMQNDMRSGNYLIVSCAHKFNMTNFTFDTVATLSRDSYPVITVTYDDSLIDKIGILNK